MPFIDPHMVFTWASAQMSPLGDPSGSPSQAHFEGLKASAGFPGVAGMVPKKNTFGEIHSAPICGQKNHPLLSPLPFLNPGEGVPPLRAEAFEKTTHYRQRL
jgi:hypothetical protein